MAHTFPRTLHGRIKAPNQIPILGVKVMNPRLDRKPKALPRRLTQTSGPRAPMRALLQPKLRVRMSGPSRHIAKRTNRINRLIWINPVDELMKGHIFPAIFTPHAGVPGNRGCRA